MPRPTAGAILKGAGIIMLVFILEAIGVPSAGVALILGVDRTCVATIVAESEGQLGRPDLSEERDRIRVRA